MPDANVSVRDFGYALYATDVYAVPAVTAGYAILCAMAVWGYLYNSRSVGLMHTLPVDRTGLFVTNTLSGLAMMLIPYAVVGGVQLPHRPVLGIFRSGGGDEHGAGRGLHDPALLRPGHLLRHADGPRVHAAGALTC